MRVSVYSRFCRSNVVTHGGRPYPSDRKPYRYQAHPDNIEHVLSHTDTLPALAGYYFAMLPRGCGLWWVLADYQPVPIINPLAPLHVGRHVIIVPSLRVLTDQILPGSGT